MEGEIVPLPYDSVYSVFCVTEKMWSDPGILEVYLSRSQPSVSRRNILTALVVISFVCLILFFIEILLSI